jgi:zinc protease
MKMNRCLLGGLALLCLAAGPTWAVTVERTLDNGMKVIVKTDRRAPVVVSQVWYKAGSMDESTGTTGVAHALEHMMFKGTTKVPGDEFSRLIAAAGGQENAFTAEDHTAYFQTLPAERLDLSMRLESDRMANLILSPDEFAKEIQVVMEERRMRTEDNPQAKLYEAFMATAYEAHPYHNPVIGWMNDLKNMTIADVGKWYRDWYAPDNAILVVVGDVEPEQVFALAKQYFGPVPAHKLPLRKTLTEPDQLGMKQVNVKAPAKLPEVILAWTTPRLNDAAKDSDPYALEVLSGILDGNDSARLPKSLVKDRQIAVSVSSDYDPVSRGPSLFTVDATPAEGKTVAEVEAALKSEIKRIQDQGVDEKELDRVKAQVLASQVFQQDSLFYQAMLIGQFETAGLHWQDIDTHLAKLKAVTAAQVQDVAKRYFIDDHLTVGTLDPQPLPKGEQFARPFSFGGGNVR